jgi:hypothetical protein
MTANILGGVANIQVQVAHNGPSLAVVGLGARIIRPEAGRIPPNGSCNAAWRTLVLAAVLRGLAALGAG